MKRYIRASFNETMPDWLRKAVTTNKNLRFSALKDNLLAKGIALDKCEFLDYAPAAMRNVLPIYLLKTDYSPKIYAPGINDNDQEYFNGRYRKLGSIAKSKLPEMAIDTVYINLDDENNFAPKRERYKDPRYNYRNNSRGEYGGQYKTKDYLGNNEYGPEYWSNKGRTFRNESRARDKSGYAVPSPEQKIAEYYEKFPNRVTGKVDSIYDEIIEVKQALFDMDLKAVPGRYESDNYSRAFNSFSRAADIYRDILKNMADDQKSKWRSYEMTDLSRDIKRIRDYLDEVIEYIG